MAFHHLYHGGGKTPFDALFPQNVAGWIDEGCTDCPTPADLAGALTTELLDRVRTEAAGHKVHVAYGLSRSLDFYPGLVDTGYTMRGDCVVPNGDEGRLQPGLQQHLICHDIAPEDIIYPIVIPPGCFLHGVYWKVEAPETGVTMIASTVRGAFTAAIDAATLGEGYVLVNAWQSLADAITLSVTGWPAAGATKLRLTMSAVILHPDTGS
jgi:hypothetical protein